MKSLISKYGCIADFLGVYVREAHTQDGWKLGDVITQHNTHKNLEDRARIASLWAKECSWPCSYVIDSMADEFSTKFEAWPERLVVIQSCKIVFLQMHSKITGNTNLWTQDAEAFLKTYIQG